MDFLARADQWSKITVTIDTTGAEDGIARLQDVAAQANGAQTGLTAAEQAATQAATQQGDAANTTGAAVSQETQSILDQIAALQAQVATQQQTISGLQAHKAMSSEVRGEIMGLKNETLALARDALPALGGNVSMVNSTFVAFLSGVRAAGDEEKDFIQTTAIMGAGLTAAGVGAAAGFFGIFDSGLTTVKNMAAQFGMTIPQVAGLQAGLQAVGLPAASATMAMRLLSVQLQQAQQQIDEGAEPNNRVIKALNDIGVNARDSAGNMLPLNVLLPQIFTNFKETADAAAAAGEPFNAAGLAGQLFGNRVGPQLTPALLEGAEGIKKYTDLVEKAGIGSEDQVGHLEALHKATATASVEFTGMADKIGSDVSPVVTQFISLAGSAADAVTRWPPALRDAIVTLPLASGGFLLLASAGGQVIAIGRGVISYLQNLVPVVNETTVAEKGLAIAEEEAAAAQSSWIPIIGVAIGLAAAAGIAASQLAGSDNAVAAAEKAKKDATDAANQATQDEISQLQQAGAGQTAIYDNLTGKAAGYTQELQALGSQQSTLNDSFRAEALGMVQSDSMLQNATLEQILSNKALRAEYYSIVQDLEKNSSEYQKLAGQYDVVSTALRALDPQIARVSQELFGSAEAARSTENETVKLAGSLGYTDTKALGTAQSMDKLAQLTKQAASSQTEAAAFTEAYAHAVDDATLADGDWASRKAQLTQLTQSHDEATKLLATDELALAEATRGAGVVEASLAIAIVQAGEALAKFTSAEKQYESDLRAAGSASTKFMTDLSDTAATESAGFAQFYGQAAASAAGSLHDASRAAVQSWQQADADVLADERALAVETNDTVRASLQTRLDADRMRLDSASQTAQELIQQEQAYLSAVQQSSRDSLTYRAALFDNELKLSHQTTFEKATDLAKWLQAEDITINAILKLEQELASATDALSRGLISAQIAIAKAGLDQLKENARESEAIASQAQSDAAAAAAAKQEARDEKAAQTELNKEMSAEIALINERTAAQKAGIGIDQQEVDLAKTVGMSKQLVSAQQLAGLHATTEATRVQAQADLDATAAAQRSYQAIADAAGGASTLQVKAAKAAFETQKEVSDASVGLFDAALAKESTAQSAFDSQQQASAAAAIQLHQSQLSFATDEASAYAALVGTITAGQGQISAITVQAAQQSLAAWKNADQAVLADERALTAQLSPEERKRLEDQLKTDQGIAADAKTTYTQIAKDASDEAAAVRQIHLDLRASLRQTQQLHLDDVHDTNAGAIADYQSAEQTVLADERGLTANLSELSRARLQAQLEIDKVTRDDRLQTVQDGIKNENDYVSAVRAAQSEIISMESSAFDAQHHMSHLTADEKRTDLARWLEAEISTVSQIMQLEMMLQNTTSAADRARIQDKIDQLKLWLAQVKEQEHEAESDAQDFANAESKAMGSVAVAAGLMAGSIASNFGTVVSSSNQVTDAAQAATDALNQMLGVVNQPSTEELGLQTQSDQLAISIAQLEETGLAATDARIVKMAAEKKALDDKISAYAAERKATVDLAQAQGELASGTTNSITVMRDAEGQIAKTEASMRLANTQTITWTDSVQKLVTAFTDLVKAQQQAASSGMGALAGAGALPGGGGQTAAVDTSGLGLTGGGLMRGSLGSLGGGGSQTAAVDTSGLGMTGGGLMRVAQYALGTSFVPSDGLAYLHRGEAVVPPDMNFGAQGGPYHTTETQSVQENVFHIHMEGAQFTGTPKQNEQMVRTVLSDLIGRGALLAGRRAK